MSFINVAVYGFATKKSLKDAVARGDRVRAYATSPLGSQFNGYLDEVPDGVTLTIVGPDPVRLRKWYASVTRVNGKVIVK